MKTHLAAKQKRPAVCLSAGTFACLLALASVGCGGGGASSVPTGTRTSTILADHLTLALSQDKTSLKAGDTVTYQITLTNLTSAPITDTYLGYHGTGPVTLDMLLIPYDSGSFRVQDPSGSLIAHDGTVAGYPPIAPPLPVSVTLQSGQSLSTTEAYTLTRPGVYTALAALQNADFSATPAAGPLTVTVH